MFREPSANSAPRASSGPAVTRRTVTEEVLERLRALLLQGVLRPGTRVDQADLAASFGVSTVPVREALLRLQSAGLVEVVPHRGVFVSEVSVEELLDIYTTRELLEEQAARLAAFNLSDADVGVLSGLAKSMQSAARKGNLDDLLSFNREFHFTIYRAAKRRHLLQLIEQLWDLSTRYAHLQLHAVPDRASEALYEIRSIVSACERKDADALGWMIRYKLHQTTAGLLQHRSVPDTGTSQLRAHIPQKSAKKTSPQKKTTAQGKLTGVKAKASSSARKMENSRSPTRSATTPAARSLRRSRKSNTKAGRGA